MRRSGAMAISAIIATLYLSSCVAMDVEALDSRIQHLGESQGTGRRGGSVEASGGFTLSSGSNAAGNDEEDDDAQLGLSKESSEDAKKEGLCRLWEEKIRGVCPGSCSSTQQAETKQANKQPKASVASLDKSTSDLTKKATNKDKDKDKDKSPSDKTKKVTNAAKCAGSTQDNSSTEGLLDCESEPFQNIEDNKGRFCLDNLSDGRYYTSGSNGGGFCTSFGSAKAYSHTTMYTTVPGSPRTGVITKGWVVHPHKASLNVGAFGMKRLKCQGTKCAMYKLGYCVKCPKPIFDYKEDFMAKPTEFDVFINCCVLGRKQYTTQFGTKEKTSSKGNTTELGEGKEALLKRTKANCPAGFGTGAFTKKNDASATLKPEYECEEKDAILHEVLLKAK